jgi:hypothetical protein
VFSFQTGLLPFEKLMHAIGHVAATTANPASTRTEN